MRNVLIERSLCPVKLLKLIKRFILRLSQRRRSKPVIEISPEAQVEIERRRGSPVATLIER